MVSFSRFLVLRVRNFCLSLLSMILCPLLASFYALSLSSLSPNATTSSIAIPTSIAVSRCEVQIMGKVRVVFKVKGQKVLFRTTKVDVMVESVVLARGEVVHISSLVTI